MDAAAFKKTSVFPPTLTAGGAQGAQSGGGLATHSFDLVLDAQLFFLELGDEDGIGQRAVGFFIDLRFETGMLGAQGLDSIFDTHAGHPPD